MSSPGFITLSGLDNSETVSFYSIDCKVLGTLKAIDGKALFSAKSGTVVIAKIGQKSMKIAIE